MITRIGQRMYQMINTRNCQMMESEDYQMINIRIAEDESEDCQRIITKITDDFSEDYQRMITRICQMMITRITED